MYRRGVEDAERGELNSFYYQHYYHYRRGHDRARRRLRHTSVWRTGAEWRARVLLAVVGVIAVAVVVFLLLPREPEPTTIAQAPEPTLPVAPSPTVTPTRRPLLPTATPTATPLALTVGGAAVVTNTGQSSLRGRAEPSLSAPVVVTFAEGDPVQVIDGPVEADGYTWWRIEGERGAGWSAEESQDGLVWITPAG